MKNRFKATSGKVLTAAVCAALLMTGCGSKAENTASVSTEQVQTKSVVETVSVSETTPTPTAVEAEEVTPTPDPKDSYKVIGEKAEGENIYEVVLTNQTGQDIKSLSVKDNSMTEAGANLLAEDDAFTVDENRVLYYDTTAAKQAVEEANAAAEEGAPAATANYEITLTLADDSTYTLHGFAFEEITEAQIHVEDNVAFVTYKAKDSEDQVSTKDMELAFAVSEAQAAADAEAAAAAQLAAEQAAAEQAAAEQAAAEQAAADQAWAEQQAAEQSYDDGGDDGCIDDGLTW